MSWKPAVLPPELWNLVIDHLPKEDKQTCLLISRRFYGITLPILFSHITISFGLWHAGSYMEYSTLVGLEEEATSRNLRTFDLLFHIATTPSFGMVIKTVYVKAFTHRESTFELALLARALRNLRNLRSFRCQGGNPMLNDAVTAALAESAGATLSDLRIPVDVYDGHLPQITGLRGLRTLVVYPPDVDDFVNKDFNSAIESLLRVNAETLRHIALAGDLVWHLPTRAFLELHTLELLRPSTLDGLSLVLRHCENLRSFAAYLEGAALYDALLQDLRKDDSVLPGLTALKIICEGIRVDSASSYTALKDLAQFLQGRTELRMLDLQIPIDIIAHPHEEEAMKGPMLDAVKTLSKLRVLGLDLDLQYSQEADIAWLDELVPGRTTALCIEASIDPASDTTALERAFLKLFRNRTCLQYLHILSRKERQLDLKQQLLEDHPDDLQLVGYGPYLRWITQNPDANTSGELEHTYSPYWPFSKVMFRTTEDYGDPEWEWLMRYKGFEDINNLPPGIRGP